MSTIINLKTLGFIGLVVSVGLPSVAMANGCFVVRKDFKRSGLQDLYENTQFAVKVGGKWVPFKKEYLRRKSRRFVFIIRPDRERHEGALIVKASNHEDVRAPIHYDRIDETVVGVGQAPLTVTIKRPRYKRRPRSLCRNRDLWHAGSGKKAASRTIRYRNYVAFHKYNELTGGPDLEELKKYNLEYIARKPGRDVCVSTYDLNNSNRQQYQFDTERQRSIRRRLSDLQGSFFALFGSARAQINPTIQVQTLRYNAKNRDEVCVYFSLSNLDQNTVVQINDLEAQDENNRNLHAKDYYSSLGYDR